MGDGMMQTLERAIAAEREVESLRSCLTVAKQREKAARKEYTDFVGYVADAIRLEGTDKEDAENWPLHNLLTEVASVWNRAANAERSLESARQDTEKLRDLLEDARDAMATEAAEREGSVTERILVPIIERIDAHLAARSSTAGEMGK
jgi:septation ring formation regulator EzrA